jgi:hypothetical protein
VAGEDVRLHDGLFAWRRAEGEEAGEFICQADHIAVQPHGRPDGDCMQAALSGRQRALGSFVLISMHKDLIDAYMYLIFI